MQDTLFSPPTWWHLVGELFACFPHETKVTHPRSRSGEGGSAWVLLPLSCRRPVTSQGLGVGAVLCRGRGAVLLEGPACQPLTLIRLDQTLGDVLCSRSVENTFLTSSPQLSGCFVTGQCGSRCFLYFSIHSLDGYWVSTMCAALPSHLKQLLFFQSCKQNTVSFFKTS